VNETSTDTSKTDDSQDVPPRTSVKKECAEGTPREDAESFFHPTIAISLHYQEETLCSGDLEASFDSAVCANAFRDFERSAEADTLRL
jgi:hypothetical protein